MTRPIPLSPASALPPGAAAPAAGDPSLAPAAFLCVSCDAPLSKENVTGFCRRCSGARLIERNRYAKVSVMTDAKVAEAKAAAAEGLSINGIAARIGVKPSTLKKYLRAYPFPVPGRGTGMGQAKKQAKPRTFTPDMVARIREAHAAGMYIAQAARHLGLHASSLSNWNKIARVWEAPSRAESMAAWAKANPEEVKRITDAARASRRLDDADRLARRAAKLARWRSQFGGSPHV